ncbi:hypothetical protein BDF22DRAFT_694659 [Syncephalis plumigaleata]|nr:hypothetical protein BDF22DRAFT_694659 [Syncephalis plumigaleata]
MGWFTKEFTNEQVPDLTGKVAVVTGANTGIGYHIALQLALHGSRVYAACRNEERAQAAIDSIKDEVRKAHSDSKDSEPDIRFLSLDLNSLAQVDVAAKKLINIEPKIHILINNAGIMGVPFTMTDDNIESHFGVNHIGPTLFTQRLLPTIRDSGTPEDPSRIVFTSSLGHYWTYWSGPCLTLDTINNERRYYSMTAYGHSKLANILTANYLARQESNGNDRPTILINSVHPGIVHSELGRNMRHSHGWIGDLGTRAIYACLGISSADGALATLYAATADEVKEKGYNGVFFVPYGRCSAPSGYAQSEELQDKLWQFTQSVIDEKLGHTRHR